jgi:hypothetical protein
MINSLKSAPRKVRAQGAYEYFAMSDKRRVIVYSVEHVAAVKVAAAKAGLLPLYISPPGAGLSHGYPWFAHLIGDEVEGLFDCADSSGAVLTALRQGAKFLRVKATEQAFFRLSDIAAQYGAKLEAASHFPELDLLDAPNPQLRCQEWFDPEA